MEKYVIIVLNIDKVVYVQIAVTKAIIQILKKYVINAISLVQVILK